MKPQPFVIYCAKCQSQSTKTYKTTTGAERNPLWSYHLEKCGSIEVVRLDVLQERMGLKNGL